MSGPRKLSFGLEDSDVRLSAVRGRHNFSEAYDLDAVLAHEQNFPPYYQVLHLLFLAFGQHDLTAISLNFVVWIASVYVFSRIAAEYFGRGPWRLLATLIYALTPSIFHYAYYIRMYAVMNLCFLLCIYLLLRYVASRRKVHLVLSAVLFPILTVLHPTGGVVVGLLFVLSLFLVRHWKDVLVMGAFVLASFAAFLFEVLQKVDVARVYLGTGIEYVAVSRDPFHTFPSKLLFRGYGDHSWLFYVLSAVLVFEFLRRFCFSRKHFPVVFFCSLFIALHVLLKTFVDSHHFYFLTAPFLLALSLGLFQLTREGVRYRALLVILPCAFLLNSVQFCREALQKQSHFQEFCKAVKGLDGGGILTDYVVFDAVTHCAPPGKHRIAVLRNDDVVDMTNLSLKGQLIVQAELGGVATSGISSSVYLRKIKAAMTGGTDPLDRQVEKIPLDRQVEKIFEGQENVYYIVAMNRYGLFSDELRLLHEYRFKEQVSTAIFRFVRNRGATSQDTPRESPGARTGVK